MGKDSQCLTAGLGARNRSRGQKGRVQWGFSKIGQKEKKSTTVTEGNPSREAAMKTGREKQNQEGVPRVGGEKGSSGRSFHNVPGGEKSTPR